MIKLRAMRAEKSEGSAIACRQREERESGFGFRISGFSFRVWGFNIRVSISIMKYIQDSVFRVEMSGVWIVGEQWAI